MIRICFAYNVRRSWLPYLRNCSWAPLKEICKITILNNITNKSRSKDTKKFLVVILGKQHMNVFCICESPKEFIDAYLQLLLPICKTIPIAGIFENV